MENLFKDMRDRLLGSVGLEVRHSNIWQGVLIFGGGLAIGAGLGLLLAPKSGRELRRQIVGLFERARDRAGQAIEEGMEGLEEEMGSGSFEERQKGNIVTPRVS